MRSVDFPFCNNKLQYPKKLMAYASLWRFLFESRVVLPNGCFFVVCYMYTRGRELCTNQTQTKLVTQHLEANRVDLVTNMLNNNIYIQCSIKVIQQTSVRKCPSYHKQQFVVNVIETPCRDPYVAM